MKIYSAQLKGTTTVSTGSNVSLTGSFTGSIYGFNDTVQYSSSVDSRIIVNTNRLNNIESKSASVDISISNINTVTSSFSPRVLNLESKSASVDISISNINAVTASNIARLSNLETKSSSVDISITNINSFTASNGNTSLNSKTGSYATTGSNTFFGTQTYSGSVNITGSSHSIFGNVGIGISSPSEKIHVFGSSGATNPRIRIQSHDTANATAGLSLYGRDASNVNKVSEIVTSGADLTISVNSAETMRITSVGNVGIGTCTPSSSLAIRSALPRVEISSTSYAGLYKSFFGSLSTAQGILQFGNNSDNYVLIGNTTAGGNLQFRANVNADYGYSCGLEAFTVYCDTSVCFAGPVKLAGAYASCLGLGTTSSPAKYLHIQGTNNFSQGIRFSEAAGAYPHNIYFGSPDSSAACWGLDFQVATTSATSATVLSLRGNCRVGINTTSPCSALHIVDSSANATTLTIGENGEVPTIKAGGTNTDLRIEAVGGGGFLEFATNSTVRIRTLSTGETCFACQICTPGISITSNPIGVEYLIVAGGGGGGWDVGGGGGAGGVLNGSTGIWPGTYNIGIGAGGAGKTGGGGCSTTQLGYNTYAIGLLAVGGGGGGNYSGGWGSGGGSGGGGAGYGATTNAGFGMKGQGFEGGCGINVAGTSSTGGAGGGAGGVGPSSISNIGGSTTGGVGIISTIIGEHRSYGCGGRGGGDNWTGPMYNGTANTGGGGDGAGSPNEGCSGGSGIVILKMKNTNSATFSGGLTTYTCTGVACYNIYVVTAGAGTVTIS
jgi:hypothetical protein